MRLFCTFCNKSVSSELTSDAVFRAVAICPECMEKMPEAVFDQEKWEAIKRLIEGVL